MVPLVLNRNPKLGIGLMILSAICATVSASLTYYSIQLDPQYSITLAAFVRVLMNPVSWYLWVAFFAMSRSRRDSPGEFPRQSQKANRLLKNNWLICWGLGGAVTVVCYFHAIQIAGIGVASLGSSLSGAVTIVLTTLMEKKSKNLLIWGGVLTIVLGLVLIKGTDDPGHFNLGWVLALLSGISGGVAYFSVSRVSMVANSFEIMLYWTLACLPTNLLLVLTSEFHWPNQGAVWIVLVFGGLFLAFSQLLAAISFRYHRAEILSVLSYLTPALVCASDFLLFGRPYTLQMFAGTVLIIGTGACLSVQAKAG